MQDTISIKETKGNLKIDKLLPEDKQRLVDAFIWLVEEDKKQNPDLYKIKKRNK